MVFVKINFQCANAVDVNKGLKPIKLLTYAHEHRILSQAYLEFAVEGGVHVVQPEAADRRPVEPVQPSREHGVEPKHYGLLNIPLDNLISRLFSGKFKL